MKDFIIDFQNLRKEIFHIHMLYMKRSAINDEISQHIKTISKNYNIDSTTLRKVIKIMEKPEEHKAKNEILNNIIEGLDNAESIL